MHKGGTPPAVGRSALPAPMFQRHLPRPAYRLRMKDAVPAERTVTFRRH
jgi:hypothetical protein